MMVILTQKQNLKKTQKKYQDLKSKYSRILRWSSDEKSSGEYKIINKRENNNKF